MNKQQNSSKIVFRKIKFSYKALQLKININFDK